MFHVIVAGSCTDYELLARKLDHLLQNETEVEIVSGGARGADQLGERYAQERGYKLRVFPADWNRYGKQAGYIRNVHMADYADALVAFRMPGVSKGTDHMIRIARERPFMSVRVVRV